MLNKPFYSILLRNTFHIVIVSHCHSVHWGIPPPQKHHPLIPAKLTLLNLQTVQVPFLRNPSSILVFREPSLKVGFFSEPQKYQSFSSLIPSYLLTKFLLEISQFEFLVMTEKIIFAHKLFCR